MSTKTRNILIYVIAGLAVATAVVCGVVAISDDKDAQPVDSVAVEAVDTLEAQPVDTVALDTVAVDSIAL